MKSKHIGLSDIKLEYLQKNILGHEILDVGAGYCNYSDWLLARNPNLHIVCIDKLDLSEIDTVSFIMADLENPIPLPESHFNTVIAFDIIEHINNEKQLLHELFRVCKSSGVLIGSVPHDDDKFLPAYNLTFYHRSDVTHKRYYTVNSLECILHEAGFSDISIYTHGGVSPHVFAEFFPSSMRWIIKKMIGGLRRIGIINTKRLTSDLFFIAKKRV